MVAEGEELQCSQLRHQDEIRHTSVTGCIVRIFRKSCTGNEIEESVRVMSAGGKTKRLYLHLQGEFQYYTFGSVHDSDDDRVVEINCMAQ